jgi:NADH:ubiquinone oxidoreductase subunit 5 (subunit L)/multisubunit Na+/H+ antiporter MnhA subunit
MTSALWLLVALPMTAGLVLLVLGRRADRWAAPVAVSAAAVGVVLAVVVAFGHPAVSMPVLAGVPVRLAVDGLSTTVVLVVTTVTLAVLVYAVGEFTAREARARFFGLMLLFAGAMLVTVTAGDLLGLLAGWEVMGAASYALIGYWWTDPDRVRSANLAFLTTRTADLGLYLAAGAALAGGVTNLSLASLPDATGPWLHVVAVGIVVAALGKSAQLPFSFWLSRAMAGPSPVSALLHSATMVAAGGYLLLRLDPLLQQTGWAGSTVAWIGVVTAAALAAVAIAQTDLKQLLAASTCSQIGFIVLAAGTHGLAGGVLQFVAHAAAKSLLFLAAGAWLVAVGTKDLRGLAGAARRHRLVGISFTVGALSLAGVPPLSIWVAKDEILTGAWDRSPWLYLAGLTAAVLSAGYAGKALAIVWRSTAPQTAASGGGVRAGTGRVTRLMGAPLPVLAGAAALLGVLAVPPLAEELAWSLGETRRTPDLWQLALSAALAVLTVGAVVGWRRITGGRPTRRPAGAVWLTGWLGLETVAVRGVAAPVMAAARALARFDDVAVDGAVRAVGAGAAGLARLTDLRAEAAVSALVRAVAGAARRLGTLARRPQTGQLHQYYAQAAVALAVLALILVLVR